jgi:hypothetical protein
LRVLWLLALAASTGALVAARYLTVDDHVEQSVAAALGVLLALGLAVRSGGRPLPAGALSALVAVAAIATQWDVLLA